MYFLLAISLIFALLLAINVLSSIAAEILWRAASGFFKNRSAAKQARFIFALSVFPFVGACVFVFAFLLPAYLLFEPHKSDEIISFKLALLSIISLIGFAAAAWRVFGTRATTRRLVSNWLKNAEPVEIENVSIPAFRINHQFPVIAVVGTFRPQMFIANRIFDALSPEELQAAIAHEHGHLAAHDNFKRTILRICRDLLVFPLGKTLERAWTETAESAADEYAALGGGNLTAVNLASALVKIARLAPAGARPAMPAGASLIAEHTEYISGRILHLLQMPEADCKEAQNARAGREIAFRFLLAGFAALLMLLAVNREFLLQVHDFTEKIVALLQ
ncbi:MAG TPA: M48 family metalloprotease [Pyrinomonadaceae bacterium]|jgi:Zn-dependent protease with chaperone function